MNNWSTLRERLYPILCERREDSIVMFMLNDPEWSAHFGTDEECALYHKLIDKWELLDEGDRTGWNVLFLLQSPQMVFDEIMARQKGDQ